MLLTFWSLSFLSYLSHCIKIYVFIYQPSHLFFYLPIYMMRVCIDTYLFPKAGFFIYSALSSVFYLVAYDKQLFVDSILNVRTTF